MVNPYFYTYYKIYSFLESINKVIKNDIMDKSAMLLLSLIVGLNTFTVFAIIQISYKKIILKTEEAGMFVMGFIILINYFIFFTKKRYQKILKKYKKKDSSLGGTLVIAYIVLSIFLFFHYGGEVRELNLK